MKPIIVIHGGAWAIPERLVEGSMTGVKRAAREGFALLESGASAVDAVEAAVRILEDDPVFDAGHGAVLNADGDVELDAIIMDGKTLAAGAICCVKNVSNPVTLARSVMEKTDHVMLSGAGANQFAASLGIEEVSTEELVTQHAREEWGQYKYSDAVSNLFNMEAFNLMSHPKNGTSDNATHPQHCIGLSASTVKRGCPS